MYKIYINETPLLLQDITSKAKEQLDPEKVLQARYVGKQKSLFHYIDLLEKNPKVGEIRLLATDLNQLWTDFKGLYKVIKAAGGVVTNPNGEILFISRMGWWDLPKGKIEKGESNKAAALREVEEETGCKNLKLGRKLMKTYHTYKTKKGKRILKKTHWFHMEADTQALTPQTEESIELAEWMSTESFFNQERIVYRNILDVLAEHQL